MKNLDAVMATKKLEDVTKDEKPLVGTSNLIEPTKAEIDLIRGELKKGSTPSEIKKTIRRKKDGAELGFSFGQIKEIEQAMEAKRIELTPKETEPITKE